MNSEKSQSKMQKEALSILDSKVEFLLERGQARKAIKAIDDFKSNIRVFTGSDMQCFIGYLILLKARIFRVSGDKAAAINVYEEIIEKYGNKEKRFKNDTDNLLPLGLAFIKVEILTSRPENLDLLVLTASFECSRLYSSLSCIDKAVNTLDSIIMRFGEFDKTKYLGFSQSVADICLEKADILFEAGRLNEARTHYTFVVKNFAFLPLLKNRIKKARSCLEELRF